MIQRIWQSFRILHVKCIIKLQCIKNTEKPIPASLNLKDKELQSGKCWSFIVQSTNVQRHWHVCFWSLSKCNHSIVMTCFYMPNAKHAILVFVTYAVLLVNLCSCCVSLPPQFGFYICKCYIWTEWSHTDMCSWNNETLVLHKTGNQYKKTDLHSHQ